MELFTVLSAEATALDHPARTFFVERYRTTLRAIEQAYEAVRAENALHPGIEPGAAARQLIAMMDGLQIQWLRDLEATDLVQEWETAAEALFAGFTGYATRTSATRNSRSR